MEPKDTGKARRRILKKEIPERLRLPLAILLSLLTGLGLSLASYLIAAQSVSRALASMWTAPVLPFWATTLLLGLLTAVLALASRSLFAGGLIVAVPVLAASYVNYFKNAFTFTPLQVSDLTLIGSLGNITQLNSAAIHFSAQSILAAAAVLLWLAVLFVFSRPLRAGWKRSGTGAVAAALLFAVLFCIPAVADGWIYAPLRAAGYGGLVAARSSDVVLNLWNGVVQREGPVPEDPWPELPGETGAEPLPGVTAAPMRTLADDLRDYVDAVDPGGSDLHPNVIVVLAESFFDLTELPGVEYDGDPLADFHRAQAEGVSGTFHTRTLSYGTCAIEMELLTGINSRYFSTDQQLSSWEPEQFDKHTAVPAMFQREGYYTAFLHTFSDSIYERRRTYPRLGFEDMYFSNEMAQVIPEAAAAEDYWGYMATRIAGRYYSDDLLADALIDLYEREGEDSPVFLYAATMENHMPYPADKYDNYEFGFSAALDAEAADVLNSVTQGVVNCSRALGKLVDYFAAVDEPTIIVFYGDHRPGLQLERGGSLYSALGMVDENPWYWTLEQIGELYATDYVIWANDESLLPAPAGTRDHDSSSNFLGLDILRMAGVELDPWWRMIASLREDTLAWTWSYYLSADGTLEPSPDNCLDADALRKMEVMTWVMRRTYVGSAGQTIYTLLN